MAAKKKPKRQMVWLSGPQCYIVPKDTKKGKKVVDRMVDEIVNALMRHYGKT